MALTPEQMNQLRYQMGIPVPNDNSVAPTSSAKNLLSGITPASQTNLPKPLSFTQGVAADAKKRNDAMFNAQQSNQNIGSKVLQTFGQGFGLVTDVAKRAGSSLLGTAKEVAPEATSAFGQGFNQTISDAVNTDTGREAINALSRGQEYYNQFKQTNPEAAANLEAGVDVLSVIPLLQGMRDAGLLTQTLTTGAKNLVKAGVSTLKNEVKNGVSTASNLISNPQTSIPEVGTIKTLASDTLTKLNPADESVFNPTRLVPKEKLKNIPIENIVAQSESKSAKYDKYLKIAEDAVTSNYKKTPLTVAGDKGTEAVNLIKNKVAKQQLIKQESLGKIGDKPVSNIGSVRAQLRDEVRDKIGLNIITDAEGISLKSAKGRVSKIAFDPADNKLLTDSYKLLADLGSKPTVRMLDDTVDALGDLLYKRQGLTATPVNSQVEGILKKMTGILNKNVKKVAGEQYSKANSKMAYMIDTLNTLNKSLGKEGERGASLMKQLFSPSGEKPRRLFAKVKEITGIDLTEEATFAKFVMENVGDARQASLLEEVIRGRTASPTGLIEKAFERTINKLQDPIGKARRVIKDIPKGQSTPIKPSSKIPTNQGKIALGGAVNEDAIMKDLMSYKPEPIKVNGKLEFDDRDFDIEKLQELAEKRALKPEELEKAKKLLKSLGVLSKSSQKKGSTAINPLTVGAAAGVGATAIANKKK